jgi:acyl carrier protein
MHNNLIVKVREIIAGHFGIDPGGLTDQSRFRDDLGADWLDRLEVMIAIEDQVSGFEIANVVADQIDTIGDLIRIIESRRAKDPAPLSYPPLIVGARRGAVNSLARAGERRRTS